MANKKLRKKVLALLAGLLLSGAVAELVARTWLGRPIPERYPQVRYVPHPHRGFALVPGDRSFTYDCEVRVNSYGLRGPEIPPKSDAEVRLFLLGDSLTFGHGVAEEQTIGAWLEQELETRAPLGRGRRYRVINGGHQGFSTRHEIDMLEELGDELQPDLVLLLWLWNDIQEKIVERPPEGTPPPPPIVAPVPAPLTFTLRQWGRKSALLLWLNDLNPGGTLTGHEAIERAMPKIDKQLARFTKKLRRLRTPGALVVLPDANSLVVPNIALDVDAEVIRLARARGIPVLEPTDAVRRCIEERGRIPVLAFDGHYDGSGNAAIARGITDGLLEQGLLPE